MEHEEHRLAGRRAAHNCRAAQNNGVALIERFVACGDSEDRRGRLWSQLMERFAWRVRAGIRNVLASRGYSALEEMAEDLEQDVYFHLLDRQARVLARFRGRTDAELSCFLYRVAQSVVLDRLRYLTAQKRGARCLVRDSRAPGPSFTEVAVDGMPDPERQTLAAEAWRLFASDCRRAVGPRSPARDLRILELVFCQGYTSREVSQRIHSLSTSGVDSVVSRARQRLCALGHAAPRRKRSRRPAPDRACRVGRKCPGAGMPRSRRISDR